MYERRTLESALQALSDLLADRGEHHVAVAIGGGALSFLGLIERSTEDIDLVGFVNNGTLITAEPMPGTLLDAITAIGALHGLNPKWMNGEPTSLLRHGLPDGFLARCVRRDFGGVTLLLASRFDQIHLKLFAFERPGDKHELDLRRLAPTRDELLSAATWVRTHAVGEEAEWELRAKLRRFGVELDDV